MKKIVSLAVMFGLITFMFCSSAYAKKISFAKKVVPAKIAPLIYKGVKFVVPNTA